MKTALLLMMMALTPALVAAQEGKEQTPPPASVSVKAFEVKPGNMDRIRGALNMIVGGGNVTADPNLNILVVKTSPQLMPAVEQIVTRLNVAVPPPKNIEFTVYVLEVAREPLPDGTIPPDLQPTVNQLRSALGYQGIRVADKTVMQARVSDRVIFTGTLANPPAPTTPGLAYQMRFLPKLLADEKPPVIQLDNLEFSAYRAGTPGSAPRGDLDISVDIREGQRVVVGKTAVGDRTLVLVLSAKILN